MPALAHLVVVVLHVRHARGHAVQHAAHHVLHILGPHPLAAKAPTATRPRARGSGSSSSQGQRAGGARRTSRPHTSKLRIGTSVNTGQLPWPLATRSAISLHIHKPSSQYRQVVCLLRRLPADQSRATACPAAGLAAALRRQGPAGVRRAPGGRTAAAPVPAAEAWLPGQQAWGLQEGAEPAGQDRDPWGHAGDSPSVAAFPCYHLQGEEAQRGFVRGPVIIAAHAPHNTATLPCCVNPVLFCLYTACLRSVGLRPTPRSNTRATLPVPDLNGLRQPIPRTVHHGSSRA